MAIGVDVGGTKILAARVDLATGATSSHARRLTVDGGVDPGALENLIVDAVTEATGADRLAVVGLAAAGFVDGPGEKVRFAPHLPWRDRAVRAVLEDRLRVPVALDNDATCAALAESRYGAGRGADSVLMVTVGTGIGGGLVVDGRVLRGAGGMAGEFGHMRLVPSGRPCPCGLRGCWEQYCSGRALLRAAGEGEDGPRSSGWVDGEAVTRAAQRGDEVARRAFASVGEWLGIGLANLVAAFDPEVVVVGGGVSTAGDLLLDPARAALAAALVGASYRQVPRVVAAELGSSSGLVGAALLASERA
jgi:glucokinase